MGRVPGGHWRRLIILGAIARDGLVAVMIIAAATSTAVFLAFLEQVLITALRGRPEALVAMDNLAPHRAAAVRAALQRRPRPSLPASLAARPIERLGRI